MPNNCDMDAKICDVNCNSCHIHSIRTSIWEIQCVTKAMAQVGAVISERGIVSGHLVKWSTMVMRWLYSLEAGSGLTRSTLMRSKQQ